MKALFALVAVLAVAAPQQGEVLEQVLVKVNGDIITKTELEAKQIAALRERFNSPVDAQALQNDEALKKALLEVTPELLVNSIDADGTREGYDIEITRRIADAVAVPVIASGGAQFAHPRPRVQSR